MSPVFMKLFVLTVLIVFANRAYANGKAERVGLSMFYSVSWLGVLLTTQDIFHA